MNNFFDFLFTDTSSLEKTFILNQNEEIDFKSLYQKSIAVANSIKNTLGTGNCILLISNNNLFFVLSYLSIIKSGNIVVPLNPLTDQKTCNFILEQCSIKYAFISKFTKIKNEKIDIVISEENLRDILLMNESSNISCTSISDDPAEIIYTSGSTGIPKGVVLSHKNLIANTTSIINYLKLNQNDRMLVVLPFYYCYGLSLLHTHLKVGGSIVFNNSFIFVGGILRDLNTYQCTGFAGVPSHFQILIRKSKSFLKTNFPFLRYVTQAGGKLASVFISEFTLAFPKIDFYVMYGQTEATARLSYLSPDKLTTKLGSIGKGIPGVKLKIIDENGKDIQPGEIGEIIAQGDNVMKGYFLDENLTNETIKNGWLFTGDLGTLDDEGYIYIISRKKDFIKVGGKRISPKEVEEVILTIPEVVDCTIEGVSDEVLGEAMKAIIVLSDDKDTLITEKDIIKHCQKSLPLFKVPTYFSFETSLKISATGKKTKY